MATNGVDPGGYYPPMVTGAPSGVGTDPYAPQPGIPAPPAANPGANPLNGYTQGSGLLSPLSGPGMPTQSFFAEDGGGIPDNQGIPDTQGTADNQGVNVGDSGAHLDDNVNAALQYSRAQLQSAQQAGQGGSADFDLTHLANPQSQFNQRGYDDGGEVPQDNQDNDVTGAIPTEPQNTGDADQQLASQTASQTGNQGDDTFNYATGEGDVNTARDKVAARLAQMGAKFSSVMGQFDPTSAPGWNAGAGSPGHIWSYLTGQGAAAPQDIRAIEQDVDPKDKMDPNDLTVAAITTARQKGGDAAAAAMLQGYRQQYDHYRAFAGAAMTGGNVDSAIDAANNAFQKLPDGQRVVFEKGDGDNIVAHLQGSDGNAKTKVNLTSDQFSELMRGPHGMFDNMINAGSTTALRKLFTGANTNDQNDQTGATPSQSNKFAQVGVQRGPNRQVQAVPREGAPGARASVTKQLAEMYGVDEDTITQVMPSPRDQFAALAKQRQQDQANKINEIKARNPLGLAQTRAQSALDVQNARNSGNLAVQRAKSDTWAQTYDLRDRNERNKLLLQAQLRQNTDAGRNAVSMARGMLNQGRTMADVDQYFKQQGVDFGQLTGLNSLGAPPTQVTTKINAPQANGQGQPNMRTVRLPDGRIVQVPAQ
jgi:hypothetical protein